MPIRLYCGCAVHSTGFLAISHPHKNIGIMKPTLLTLTQKADEPAPAHTRPYRERLLRIDDVCFMTGLGRSTVYAKVKARDFPGPVQLHGACVAWRETEVDAWIAGRPAAPTLPADRAARQTGVPA